MLVLTRRRGEIIKIGHDIEICVAEIEHDRVRLGVTAPDHVEVHREEIYDLIQKGIPQDEAIVRAKQPRPVGSNKQEGAD